MNQGKIWLVVKPTVGLPVFFAAIVVGSLCVHLAVLSHSGWLPAFFNGGQKAKATAAVEAPAVVAVAPVAAVTAKP